jgi:16S rRNA (adenine1518-N6/adenine1519-N6)-dimethyltransferase
METAVHAKKRFGQHFLANRAIARRIAEAAGLTHDDTVLEIGPGLGILTTELLDLAGHVTAIEIDRTLFQPLRELFGGNERFRLVEGDFLAAELDGLFPAPQRRIVVCANIPYNITSPIIERICVYRHLIGSAVLMVQREVADRLLAAPGSRTYGLPTVNLALCASIKRIMTVAPGSFRPPPEVTSSVIALDISEHLRFQLDDETVFRDLTGALFRQRRKMIRNTLAPFLATSGLDRDTVKVALEAAGIDPSARPETIDTARFVTLANTVARMRRTA